MQGGYKNSLPILSIARENAVALELTKWFTTNYAIT